MRTFLAILSFSFLVYLGSWVFTYSFGINDLPIQSEDTLPAMFLPISIIKEGNLYLDNYYKMIIEKYPHPDDKDYQRGLTPYYLRKAGDHYVSAFPITTSLLALPVYAIPIVLGLDITWENITILSHVVSAMIVSLSGGVLFLLLKEHFSLNKKKSLLLTIIYLFGTINLSTLSQSLWQHGTLQLFVLLGMYCLFDFMKTKKSLYMFLSGLFFGLGVLSRPTGLLPLVLLLLFFVLNNIKSKKLHIKDFLLFSFGILLNLAFFYWYTKTYYISVANQGYANQLTSWLSPFPEGFLGTWFSPSKGILIYSPIFIFSFVGLYLSKNKDKLKYFTFGLIVLVHTLILSLWKHWYGGWSFGYRMSSDVLPFLVLLIVPFVKSKYFKKYVRVFYSLLIISILVNLCGIFVFDGVWHAAYDLGYENTSWLWSVENSEFIFNVRRLLVKVGLLEKACPKCLPTL